MNETRHREEAEHGRAWWTWVLIGIGVVGALALLATAYVTFTGSSAENERDESNRDKAAIAAPANESANTILELCEKDNRVAKVLRRKGLCDTSEQVREEIRIQVLEGPEGPPGSEGPRGVQGPGPTEAQVLLAVQQHCQAQPGGSCEGPGPTRAEVRAAVVAFCADGRCRGPQGEQGPVPSDAQVDAAVDRHCSGPSQPCRGEPGADGSDGADGVDGADGKDGEPPFSWTWTDEGSPSTDGDDTTYTCHRDEPFDKSKPTYHCFPTGSHEEYHEEDTG